MTLPQSGDVLVKGSFREIYRPDSKSYGLRKFFPLDDFQNPTFVSGDFKNGGDIVFVLDMVLGSQPPHDVTRCSSSLRRRCSRCGKCC